jgi:hypothetical protein
MARSRMVRVDADFAKTIMKLRDEAQTVRGKKISGVYITRVIGNDIRRKRFELK